MEPVDLPVHLNLNVCIVLDWKTAPAITPNLEALKRMKKTRSRQSETSRKRQAFISGMSVYRATAEEQAAKRRYLADFDSRIGYDEMGER